MKKETEERDKRLKEEAERDKQAKETEEERDKRLKEEEEQARIGRKDARGCLLILALLLLGFVTMWFFDG